MSQRPFGMRCKFCYHDYELDHHVVCPVIIENRKPEWVDKFTNKIVKEVKPKGKYL